MSDSSDSKPLLLIVEDEEAIRKLLRAMLSDIARIETATNGFEALEWLREQKNKPRAILTDLMMPKLDGLEFAKRAKKMPSCGNIPIVMLTAKDRPMDLVSGVNAGARHYLTKPFTRDQLLEKLGPLLR